MTPIRPANLSVPPAAGQGAEATRSAAQKAFFDAAMGRAGAAAAPRAAVAVAQPSATQSTFAPAPQRAERRPDPDAPAPARLLRPGSLLDIRI